MEDSVTIWFLYRRLVIILLILLLMVIGGMSVAQESTGTPASIEPVDFATRLKWAIDLLVPIARNEVAIHPYADDFPQSTDIPEHVRWFVVWSTDDGAAYQAVPVSLQSSPPENVQYWLNRNDYIEEGWEGTAWVGTNFPISGTEALHPVYRADLREFTQQ